MKALLSFIIVSIFIISCSDFIEENISKDQVNLITPMNHLVTLDGNQTYTWEALDGATGYEIQIVSPSFDSVVSFIAKTDLGNTTRFDTSLLAGIYQWKLIAYNDAYESESEVYGFEILEDTIGSIANKSIQLISPSDDLITNDTVINFLWEMLPKANSYSIQVADPDFSNSTFIFVDEEITVDNYSATLSEGTYRWRVRGENDLSVSPYIERVFTIDLTPPNAPDLVTPLDGDTLTLPDFLTWDFDPTSSMDTLYVYTDSLVSSPILQLPMTDSSFEFDDNTSSQYFWRVRSVDMAGNVSEFSPLQKFYIQ